jgi:hypothetical protein
MRAIAGSTGVDPGPDRKESLCVAQVKRKTISVLRLPRRHAGTSWSKPSAMAESVVIAHAWGKFRSPCSAQRVMPPKARHIEQDDFRIEIGIEEIHR